LLVSTPENADKVINLTTNRGGGEFLITRGADEKKISPSGTTPTFKTPLTILKLALVVVKVRSAAAVSISVALRVPIKKLTPLSSPKTT
jgi:hypothetical protein